MMELSSIADRREIWIAMSDLFLDTDVRLHYAYVARVAAASPYSMDELEAIFRDEVSPALESNLQEVAGEWAGFDEEWLVEAIAARKPGGSWLPAMATDDFRAVAALAGRLRALPPEQREARSRLWQALLPLFLDRRAERPTLPADRDQLEWVYRQEMLPAYGASVGVYYEQNPKLYPKAEEIETRWKEWLSAEKTML